MTTFTGVIDSVRRVARGSALAADAVLGATVLSLINTADFDEEIGGTVGVNGQVVQYLTVDEDLSTITLATGLTAAAFADDFVAVWDTVNQVGATEVRAFVGTGDDIDEGAAIDARVNLSLVHLLTIGDRDENLGEAAQVQQIEDEWVVMDLPGITPLISGTIVDSTLLVYDGTPASGSLLASIAGTSKTDTYGNAIQQGLHMLQTLAHPLSARVDLSLQSGGGGSLLLGNYGGPEDLVIDHNPASALDSALKLKAESGSLGIQIGSGPPGNYYARDMTWSMALATGVLTQLTTFTTVRQHTDYGTPWSAGVFTAPVDSYYDLSLYLSNTNIAASTQIITMIRHNGNNAAADNTNNTARGSSCGISGLWLANGDTITFHCQQTGVAGSPVCSGNAQVMRRL